MKLTRRHARAAAAGAATAALYLAGGKLSDSRYVRGSALFALASLAVVGIQTAEQTSNLSKRTSKRLDQHISDASGAVHLNNLHGTQLTNLANNSTNLLTLAGANDVSFLASIFGPLPHQTTANATISTTAGTFTNSERIAFNGLVNAVNNLQSNLQSNNIES